MQNNTITYIEFKSTDIAETKIFYSNVFGWTFKDFGEQYTSFADSGVMGGFEQTDENIQNSILIVLYYDNLDEVQQKIIDAGGKISKEVFEFPGGKRFHFTDPSGNELAVWSDK
ncbi:VOC family protein [Patescibacteria group bacterium]|nr:VOC family protein [Patescibacteria group bacterium]MBU1721443.1 VOC family protein [Patescibacteria group bacterium]MBU1901305.1 VOC family protein [Patescibacteria group bacterium]